MSYLKGMGVSSYRNLTISLILENWKLRCLLVFHDELFLRNFDSLFTGLQLLQNILVFTFVLLWR